MSTLPPAPRPTQGGTYVEILKEHEDISDDVAKHRCANHRCEYGKRSLGGRDGLEIPVSNSGHGHHRPVERRGVGKVQRIRFALKACKGPPRVSAIVALNDGDAIPNTAEQVRREQNHQEHFQQWHQRRIHFCEALVPVCGCMGQAHEQR